MTAVTLLGGVDAGAEFLEILVAVKLDDVFAFKGDVGGVKARIENADAHARSHKALSVGACCVDGV